MAALMIQANPRLTPDDIEAVLTHPSVVHELPGTDRAGAGELDLVAAVRLAAKWPS